MMIVWNSVIKKKIVIVTTFCYDTLFNLKNMKVKKRKFHKTKLVVLEMVEEPKNKKQKSNT